MKRPIYLELSPPVAQEAIEVGVPRGLCLGGSWRYIAVGLARGAIEVGVQRRLCLGGSWRYIAVGLAKGLARGGEERRRGEDGRRVEI